jgi:hypothetical protein
MHSAYSSAAANESAWMRQDKGLIKPVSTVLYRTHPPREPLFAGSTGVPTPDMTHQITTKANCLDKGSKRPPREVGEGRRGLCRKLWIREGQRWSALSNSIIGTHWTVDMEGSTSQPWKKCGSIAEAQQRPSGAALVIKWEDWSNIGRWSELGRMTEHWSALSRDGCLWSALKKVGQDLLGMSREGQHWLALG